MRVTNERDLPRNAEQEAWFDRCAQDAAKIAEGWRAALPAIDVPDVARPIAGAYSIYTVHDWREIAAEQTEAMIAAGLPALGKIFVSVVGPDDGEWTIPAGFEFTQGSSDPRLGEWLALAALQRWAIANPTGYCWYAHTKGVSRPKWAKRQCVDEWRRLLGYFCFTRNDLLRACLAGHDVAGVEWYSEAEVEAALAARSVGRGNEPAYDQFSGNFWWARADWLARLPAPLPTGQRYDAEAWVCRGKPRVACVWKSGRVWHYHESPPVYQTVEAVEETIAAAGSGDHRSCGGKFTGGLRLWQDPRELAALVGFLQRQLTETKQAAFGKVLEIGVASGGFAKLFSELVPAADYFGLDEFLHADAKHQAHNFPASGELFRGDSHGWRAQRWAIERGPFDLIFVDGDHSYAGAQDDLHLALEASRPGSLVALHDCRWSAEVRRLCRELDAGRYPWFEPVWRHERHLGWSLYRVRDWRPAVAVITPDYDRFGRLAAVLEGLRRQDVDPLTFEVVIVQDGGAWEATRELVRAFRPHLALRYLYLDPPTGAFRLAQSRNLGASVSRSARYLFLDNDCVPWPDVVRGHASYGATPIMVAGFRRYVHRKFADQLQASDFAAIRANCWNGDQRWRYPDLHHLPLESGFAGDFHDRASAFCWGCQFSVPAAEYRAIGGHHEDFVGWGWEDNDLVCRLFHQGCGLVARPDLLVYHLDHALASRANAEANKALALAARNDPSRQVARGRFLTRA